MRAVTSPDPAEPPAPLPEPPNPPPGPPNPPPGPPAPPPDPPVPPPGPSPVPPFPPPPPDGPPPAAYRGVAPAPGSATGPPPPAVYRAAVEPEPMTQTLPSNAAENSGSLTGFILSRGRVDWPRPRRRAMTAVLVLLVLIGALTVLGLVVVTGLLSRVLGT